MLTPEEPPSTTLRPEQKPNSRQPISAPCGRNLPKMTAAMAIKPWPTMEMGRNCVEMVMVTQAPPRPARKPEMHTQAKRMAMTLMPSVSQAWGCSPQARRRRPKRVL